MTSEELRAKSIFLEAVARHSPETWDKFIERECRGDGRLRRRVEQLLKAHLATDSVLDHADGRSPVGSEPAALVEGPGRMIGPYRLEEEIGEGGFGVVYRAEQQQPVRRDVALKILKPGMDTRQVIARFQIEQQALALMDHPHIAKVFDAGATESGRPFFAMELVAGIPITEYCDRHKMDVCERLELFVKLCEAVQHAHQKGVIHRDIKPSNVMVATQDGHAALKVIDFGIAKAINGRVASGTTTLTSNLQMLGTPLYMSPEQAELNRLGVDTRTDIYSLGVLLFELLTGATPFDKERLKNASESELRRIICEEDPPRPSAHVGSLSAATATTLAERRRSSGRRLAQHLRGDLDWIVMKCMAKDRNRRYASASELALDVRRFLRQQPVEARPPSFAYRLNKFIRRNKAAAAFMALLVVSAGALGAATIRLMNERHARLRALDRAIAARENATRIADLMQELLNSANADNGAGSQYTVRQLLDDFSVTLNNQLAEQPEVESELRLTVGRAYRSLGLVSRAEPHLKRACDINRRLYGPNSPEHAESQVVWGMLLAAKGEYRLAERFVNDALRIYERTAVTGRPLVRALQSRQFLLRTLYRFDEAEVDFKKAYAMRDPATGLWYPEIAHMLHTHAEALLFQNHVADSVRWARKAVEVHRRLQGPTSPGTAWALRALGDALHRQGDLAGAKQAYSDAMEIFANTYGWSHPNTITAREGVRAVSEALQDSVAIDQLTRTELANVTGQIAAGWLQRAKLHQDLQEWSQAAAACQAALELMPVDAHSKRADIARDCQELGFKSYDHGDRSAAEHAFQLAIESLDDVPKDTWSSASFLFVGRSGFRLAGLLCERSELKQGEDRYEDAIEIFQKAADRFPQNIDFVRWLGNTHRDLAICLARRKRLVAAAEHSDASIRHFSAGRAAAPDNPWYLDLQAGSTVQLATLRRDLDQRAASLEQLKHAARLYAEGARDFPDYTGQHFRRQENNYFQVRHWRCQAEITLHLASDVTTYREAAAMLSGDSLVPADKSACQTILKAIDKCLEAANQDGSLDEPARTALVNDLRCRGDRIRSCDFLLRK